MPRGVYLRPLQANTGVHGISHSLKRGSSTEEIFSVYFRDECGVSKTRQFYIGISGSYSPQRYQDILEKAIEFRRLFHHE